MKAINFFRTYSVRLYPTNNQKEELNKMLHKNNISKSKYKLIIQLTKNNYKIDIIDKKIMINDINNYIRIKHKFTENYNIHFGNNIKHIKTILVKDNINNYYLNETYLSFEFNYNILNNKKAIGIDLGIKNYITTSDNNFYHKPDTSKLYRKLEIEKQKLINKRKRAYKDNRDLLNCKNYQKQRIKVSKLYKKIHNININFINQTINEILTNYDIVCLENLDIKEMMKNKKMHNKILMQSWNTFVKKIVYQAKIRNKKIYFVNKYYSSTNICSHCKKKNNKLKLNERVFNCSYCGLSIDRDVNASINILNAVIR
ncbi:IS605 OrfB family transposase [Bacilli bacterium PM5-9]|nr:IS605 OrfB family transposase [Bacilli bacterium PM5-9]